MPGTSHKPQVSLREGSETTRIASQVTTFPSPRLVGTVTPRSQTPADRSAAKSTEEGKDRALGTSPQLYASLIEGAAAVPLAPAVSATDEHTPKSVPKNEKDQYIRKRMIMEVLPDGEAATPAQLKVGAYLDLSMDPDDPHGKDTIALTADGVKIGYVAKKDRPPLAAGLNLHRTIYGVITDVITENNVTKYEYETWFEMKR